MFKLVPVLLLMFTGHVFRQDLATARQAELGGRVSFTGTVTSVGTLGNLAFVQDATAGIAVYDSAFSANVTIGDVVSATGEVTEFGSTELGNGLLELVAITDLEVTDNVEVQPTRVHLADLDEDIESMYVTVDAELLYRSPGCMQPYTNIHLRGTDVTLWIDGQTNLAGAPIPTTSCSVTGIVTEWQGQRQITPLHREEIDFPASNNSVYHTGILTLNTRFLGSDTLGATNDSMQVELIAGLILDNEAEIVALQEVQSQWAIDYLLDLLPGYEAAYEQPLLFQNNVTLHNALELSRTDWYALESPGTPWPGGRKPIVTEFVDNQWNAFRLVNIHAKAGDGVDDWQWRNANATELLDSVLQWNNRAVLVTGDFNDLAQNSIADNEQSPYKDWHEAGEFISQYIVYTHLPTGSTIDHAFVLENGHRALAEARVLFMANVDNYCDEVSDHLPVLTELTFGPPSSVEEDAIPCFSNDVVVYSMLGQELLRGTTAHVRAHAPRNIQCVLVSACSTELIVFH